jgi:hypothetical protein
VENTFATPAQEAHEIKEEIAMNLFVMFIVGAVMLGSGAMLAPAWRTIQPRIGLSATFAMALVTGGAVFWAYLFGWDTLVVDYLLFALVSIVVLGGTLSQAQTRAEAKGEVLEDADQGWTSAPDLAFFAVIAILFIIPLVVMSVPSGTTGMTLSLHTLAARLSGQFDTLAPFFADVSLYQAPGFVALTAYLSHQLLTPVAITQFNVGTVVAFLCIWLAYDWGSEIKNKVLGRAFAVVCFFSGGVFLLYTSGQYTTLLATAFAFGTALTLVRVARHNYWSDVIGAGLFLGAVIYTDLALGVLALAASLMFSTVFVLVRRNLNLGLRLLAVFGVAFAGTAPWLFKTFGRENPLMFMTDSTIWGWMILPVTAIGGYLLYQIFERTSANLRATLRRAFYPILLVSGVLVGVFVFNYATTQKASLPTQGDLTVMAWAARNLPSNAVVFNYSHEDWALGVMERRLSFYPIPPYGLPENYIYWSQKGMTFTPEGSPTYMYLPASAQDIIAGTGTLIFQSDNARLYQNDSVP